MSSEISEGKISRRHFLRLSAIAAAAGAAVYAAPGLAFCPSDDQEDRPQPRAIPAPALPRPFPVFNVGLHNAHLLDGFVGLTVRVPLNRAPFDKDMAKTGLTPVQRDPFYGQKERLLGYRAKSSRTILILEIHAEDSNAMLAKMFDDTQKTVGLGDGDNVVLGNELNAIRDEKGRLNYPPKTYVSQAGFLQRHIKEINKNIKIGLAGEAWFGKGEFLNSVLGFLDFPFDFLPIHCYGLPQDIPSRVSMYRSILSAHKLKDIPITIGETGVADSSYAGNPQTFLEAAPQDETHVILKSLCFAKSAGCTSVAWYSALDTFNGVYMERYGLVNDKGEKRLMFRAFDKAQGIFNKASSITGEYREGLWSFTLSGLDFTTKISWSCPDANDLGGPVDLETIG